MDFLYILSACTRPRESYRDSLGCRKLYPCPLWHLHDIGNRQHLLHLSVKLGEGYICAGVPCGVSEQSSEGNGKLAASA